MVGGNRFGIFAERKLTEKRIMTINMGVSGFEFDTIRHPKRIMTEEEIMQEVAMTINNWYEDDFEYVKCNIRDSDWLEKRMVQRQYLDIQRLETNREQC
jgi:hypothetical protein